MEFKTKYESIALMGKIASGKGTQATEIVNAFGGVVYSNGNKMRETLKKDTVLGRKLKEQYESGLLLPEWIASYWMTHAIVTEFADERLVFEAVAKKPDEAVLFNEIHEWLDRPYIVFNLNISDDTVRERSQQRHRDVVDSDEVVTKRLAEYAEFTEKSIDHFRSFGTLIDIDGEVSPEKVTEQIFKHLTTI